MTDASTEAAVGYKLRSPRRASPALLCPQLRADPGGLCDTNHLLLKSGRRRTWAARFWELEEVNRAMRETADPEADRWSAAIPVVAISGCHQSVMERCKCCGASVRVYSTVCDDRGCVPKICCCLPTSPQSYMAVSGGAVQAVVAAAHSQSRCRCV